ncbi:hypothetical protein ACETK8_03610 [Brevundimonas staleyi]|uniref:Uncharacterized protein n=2 Tax=Brevundimonas staleyi TaxID=74326 RepID=A0ABW0FV92_9CAUL
MLGLAVVTLMAAAVMIGFPETPVARSMRRWLIEAPARWLNRKNVWRTLFYVGLAAAGLAMIVLFEAEGAILYGAMAPEILTWAVLFDVGVLIDALLIAAAVMATNGLRVARLQAKAFTERLAVAIRRTAGRARRARPAIRPTKKPAADDRPAWGLQPAYRAFSMA